MNRNQTVIFFTLSIINIVSGIIENEWLGYITKPLLMITLGFFYFKHTQTTFNTRDKIVLLALLFSCLGDTFLMFQKQNQLFFLLGLGSFLLAQVCYVILFQQEGESRHFRWLPFISYSCLLLFFLLNKLPSDFKIPIIIYSVVITLMGIRASERKVSDKSYQLVLIGAIIFILSDSLIALSKFVVNIPLSGLWIMATYVVAQYMIIQGLLVSRKA
ncbi:lysoplasmalogenase [Emticicia sp. BO119]|uniref:lysoplasmalogenase n=1 Tax=Emticicia sp. BO119 TaxID=2757768 RepID=UPI0015F0B6BF|nr:lysoplasmalogenase [Emticicia sp. BO119]MBA4852742.1 lysoplasmalogenase [Emticicia sp. BO119]